MNMFAAIAQTKRKEQLLAAATPVSVAPTSRPPVALVHETYSQTASFFIKLRQYLGLTREQAAALLKTSPSVIAALETGHFADLPPWPHTRRIVWDYAALAGIDPAPALHCLELCLETVSHIIQPARQSHLPYAAQQSQIATLAQQPNEDDDAGEDDEPRRPSLIQRLGFWMPRAWLTLRIAAVMLVLAFAGLFTQGWMLQAAMSKLPSPLGSLIREARDAILMRTSAKFEGMTWIDVSDPRSRKADKLPVKHVRQPARLSKN